MYLALLLELSQLHEQQNATNYTIEVLEELIAREPLHELAHTRLMRLYAQSGQRQPALHLYEQLQQTLTEELDMTPEPASEQLYKAIRSSTFPEAPTTNISDTITTSPAASAQRYRHIPAPISSFVGRANGLAALRQLLSTTRLLTLIGTGGCDKTRPALQLTADRAGHDADAVCLTELAPLADARLVPQTMLSALGLEEQTRTPLLDTLIEYMQSQRLLLDNCEHVIDGCAPVIEALLQACPRLRILATSRAALRLPGELLWQVPPLALPEPDDGVGAGF